MKRTFNYTNRKRIPREKVQIALKSQGENPPSFDSKIDLTDLKLPDAAQVFVEAYYRNSYMRFSFGVVGRIRCNEDRTLRDIDNRELIHFGVKVVDPSGEHGKLLAEADGIIPNPSDGQEERICILEVKPEDLGNQAWALDLTDGATPTLIVNERLNNKEYIRSDETFFALVYPAVVREILTKILLSDDYQEYDVESDDWKDRWLHFICSLPAVNDLPAGEDELPKLQWIEDAVRAFCDSQTACSRYLELRSQEDAA